MPLSERQSFIKSRDDMSTEDKEEKKHNELRLRLTDSPSLQNNGIVELADLTVDPNSVLAQIGTEKFAEIMSNFE